MACRKITSPITGKQVISELWNNIYKEVNDEDIADALYKQTTTSEFLNWFGNWINNPQTASKVVYDTGEPRVVYHRTNVEFEVFKKDKIGSDIIADFSKIDHQGFYFSDIDFKEHYTDAFSKRLGNIKLPIFLNIRNPKDTDIWGDTLTLELEQDGVIRLHDGYTEYIALEPSQIKSVFNKGQFNARKKNIYAQLDSKDEQIYFNQLTENTPKLQKETVEKILKIQNRVAFQGGKYILDNTKTLKRVSEIVSEQGDYYGFDGDSSEFKDNRAWGDQLDLILSGVILKKGLENIVREVQESQEKNFEGSTATMSKDVMFKSYQIFKDFVEKHDDSIILTQQIVFNEELEIAGTVDVLLIKPDGTVEVVDLKSSISPTKYNAETKRFENYDKVGTDGKLYKNNYKKKFKNKASKYERHQAQQSMYKGLLTSKGFEFSENPLSILPIYLTEIEGNEVVQIEEESVFPLEANQNFINLVQKDVYYHNDLDISKFSEYQTLVERIKKTLESKRVQLQKQNKPSNASYIQYIIDSIETAEYAKVIDSFINEAHNQFLGNEKYSGLEEQVRKLVKKLNSGETDKGILTKLHDIQDIINLYNPQNNNIIRDLMTMFDKASILENKEILEGSPLHKLGILKNSIEKTERLVNDLLPTAQAEILSQHIPQKVNDKLIRELERRNKRRLQYLKQGKKKAAENLLKQIIKGGGRIVGNKVVVDTVDKARIEHFLKSGSYKDISFLDSWLTPAISSSNPILATFAKAVKEAFESVRIKMIDSVKIASDKFEEYKKHKGISSDNNPKFNEGLYETVNINGKDQLAFVQPIDITKYKRAQRELYSSLENVDKGSKRYKDTIKSWYKNNLQPRPKKDITLGNQILIKGIDSIIKEKAELYGENSFLFKQWKSKNIIKVEGVITYRGELAIPKLDLYFNPAFSFLTGAEATFESIQQNSNKSNPKLDYYKYLLDEYFEAQKLYPGRQDEWSKFVLPAITKSSNDRLRENGIKDYFQYKTKDAIRLLEEDEDSVGSITQSNFKFVPLLYQYNLDANDTSLDLVLSVVRFKEAALRYREQSNLVPLADTLLETVKSTDPVQTTSLGIKIIDKAAKKMGIGSFVKYKDKHKGNNVAALLEAFIDAQIYGKKEISQTVNIPVIGEVEMGKVANSMMSYMAKTQIAFNPLLSVANSLQANVMVGIEAAAGEFFTKKEWGQALLEYEKLELRGDFFNEKWNNKVAKTKIGQLIELYDPLQGEYKDRMGRNISRSALKRFTAWDTAFMLQHKGEHHIQITTLIALLKKKQVVINGERVSLYDAYKLNPNTNKLEISDGNPIIDKSLRDRLHAINKRLHGVYNEFDRPQIERYWWGRLMMMYRKFAAPGFKRRYKDLGQDLELDALTEGYYVTFFRLMRSEMSELLTLLNPFSKEGHNLSELEKANVKRTLVELASITLLGIMIMLLKSASEDDEDSALLAYPLYWSMRLQTELQFYGLPGDPTQGYLGFFLPDVLDTYRLAKTPTVATTMIEKVFRLIHQLGNPTEEYKRKTGVWEKGDYKLKAKVFKILGITGNTFSPEQAIKNLELSKI